MYQYGVSERFQNDNLPKIMMMISRKLKRDTQAKEEKTSRNGWGENRN